jgi:zinc transport system substrate-binding protein
MKKYPLNLLAICLAASLLILAAAGCQGPGKATSAATTANVTGRPIVAVGIVPQMALAKAVCGDLAVVFAAVPPGFSPENYEPTPQKMAELQTAVVYFEMGVPAESGKILNQIDPAKVVDLPAKVAKVYPDRIFADGGRDPHMWLSPKRAIVMTQAIADRMGQLLPAQAEAFQANAQAYISQLTALDQEIRGLLKDAQGKRFYIYHPSLGYLADDYGLQMMALEEEGKQATPQSLQNLIDQAKKDGIQTVFAQAEIDSRQLNAFAEEVGCKIVVLDPLAEDYIANLRVIATALAEAAR